MIKIDGKSYMRPDELAGREGVTVQTIYNRIKEGLYKTRKLMDKTLVEV